MHKSRLQLRMTLVYHHVLPFHSHVSQNHLCTAHTSLGSSSILAPLYSLFHDDCFLSYITPVKYIWNNSCRLLVQWSRFLRYVTILHLILPLLLFCFFFSSSSSSLATCSLSFMRSTCVVLWRMLPTKLATFCWINLLILVYFLLHKLLSNVLYCYSNFIKSDATSVGRQSMRRASCSDSAIVASSIL